MKLKTILRRRGGLLCLCYAAFALAFLAVSAFNYASDALARAQGSLTTQTLTAADFTLADLEVQADGTLLTQSSDPQMHRDVTGQTVRNLTVVATFEGAPREMCLYYTTKPDQDFSQDARVYAQDRGNGSYLYTLPHRKIYALRLDPCSPATNESVTMTLDKIVLNTPATLGEAFLPSWYQCFCFALYPALCAAALKLIFECCKLLKKYKNK